MVRLLSLVAIHNEAKDNPAQTKNITRKPKWLTSNIPKKGPNAQDKLFDKEK
jgi:hypothetical protein